MIKVVAQMLKTRVIKRFTLVFSFLFTSCLVFLPSYLYPQDTIRYMSYNLLSYGLPYSDCNEQNNNISLKDKYIRDIFSYTQPDLFAVVELQEGIANAQRLLDSAINAAGPRTFAKAGITNFSNSNIINMLYYDPEKFFLQSQDVIITGLRDINLYNFYLKTNDLGTSQDTITFTVIIAHLKAGSGQSNADQRATMAQTLMSYLSAQQRKGNIIISGDFNLYTSNEQAYQILTQHANGDIRFYDPIDTPGDWNSNATFAGIHTQSTHISSNGCAASGGLDDRFDFILTTQTMMLGTEGMMNITDTYHALGQDGLHFNNSLTAEPLNVIVPPLVLDALYNNSDHLPVVMDIRTDKALSVKENITDPWGVSVINPASGQISLHILRPPDLLTVDCIDFISRRTVASFVFSNKEKYLTISAASLNPGLYLLRLRSAKGLAIVKKVIVL